MKAKPTAIDLFAGCGGFTTGAAAAGWPVLWAANHWPEAVAVHEANHPETQHACQDLHQAAWDQIPRADVVLASPACQGHSRARGQDRPHHDATRSTAWAVVSCAEYHRPRALVVENVPEFASWSLYPCWADALRRLGYSLTTQIIDAADCGVPQNRRRLFVVGHLGGPIELGQPDLPHVPFGDIVDFESGNWSQIDKPGRSPATLARIAADRRQHGDRFVAPYYGSGSGKTGRSLDRPIGTITTKERWSLIDGDRMRMITLDESRAAMGFPAGYELPQVKRLAMHLLGNAVVPPVATWICRRLEKVL